MRDAQLKSLDNRAFGGLDNFKGDSQISYEQWGAIYQKHLLRQIGNLGTPFRQIIFQWLSVKNYFTTLRFHQPKQYIH